MTDLKSEIPAEFQSDAVSKETKTQAKLVYLSIFLVAIGLATVLSTALYISATSTKAQAAILPSAELHKLIQQSILGNIEETSYEPSFSIYAKNFDTVENPVPLLFDISGSRGTSFVQRALARCLKFRQISMKRAVETVHTGEYYNTNSICDFASTHGEKEVDRKVKIFILFRNPIISSIMRFKHMTNPKNEYYNPALNGTDFREYMRSSMSGNMLTRSLLCKSSDDELTDEDFNKAKEFLFTRCTVELYDDHGEKALTLFASTFKNLQNELSTVGFDECVEHELKGAESAIRSITDFQVQLKDNIDILAESHNYDMKLYYNILKLKGLGGADKTN